MRVFCSGKGLKQPIEFEIPDKDYEKIMKLEGAEEQNKEIAAHAIRHVKKYGYNFGFCRKRNKNVDFNFCVNCGIKQGQTRDQWKYCKEESINYLYPMSSMPKQAAVNDIKDEKIKSKLELTQEELRLAKDLYLIDKK